MSETPPYVVLMILNDILDGKFIKENMLRPTRIITSIDDPVLKPVEEE